MPTVWPYNWDLNVDAANSASSLGAGVLGGVANQFDKLSGAVHIGKSLWDMLSRSPMDYYVANLYDQWVKDNNSNNVPDQFKKMFEDRYNVGTISPISMSAVTDPLREISSTIRDTGQNIYNNEEGNILDKILYGIGNAAVEVPAMMSTHALGPVNFAVHNTLPVANAGDTSFDNLFPAALSGVTQDAAFNTIGKAITGQVTNRAATGALMGSIGYAGTGDISEAVSSSVVGAMLANPTGKPEPIETSMVKSMLQPNNLGRETLYHKLNATYASKEPTLVNKRPPWMLDEIISNVVASNKSKNNFVSESKAPSGMRTGAVPPEGKSVVVENKLPYSEFTERGWMRRMLFDDDATIAGLSSWAIENGVDLKDRANPAFMLAAQRGYVVQSNAVIEAGPFLYNRDVSGKAISTRKLAPGFKEMMNQAAEAIPIPPGELNSLLDNYFKATRVLVDKRSSSSKARIRWAAGIMRDINSKYKQHMPALQKALAMKNSYFHGLLDILVESGIYDANTVATIKSENKNFIPFRESEPEMSVREKVSTYLTGKKDVFGSSAKKKPLSKYQSGKNDLANSLDESLAYTYRVIKAATDNRLRQAIIGFDKYMPDLVKRSKRSIRRIDLTDSELKKLGSTEDVGSIFRPKENISSDEMVVFSDGKPDVWSVPLSISRLFKRKDPEVGHAMTTLASTLLQIPAQTARVGNTLFLPFHISNIVRDNFSAFVNTNYGFKPMFDPIKGMFDIAGKSDLYLDYLRSGAARSGYNSMSAAKIKKDIDAMLGKKSFFSKLNIINSLEEFGSFMEHSTRVGVFRAGKRKGAGLEELAYSASQSTVDFSQGGEFSRALNKYIPFFKVGMSGLERSYRAAFEKSIVDGKRHPVSFAMKVITTLTLPEVLMHLAATRSDDETREEYIAMPDTLKDYFFNFKVGGEWIHIPKPYGIGQVFGSAAGRALRHIDEIDPKALDVSDFGRMLLNGLTPISNAHSFAPQALDIVLSTAYNEDSFTGYPLFPGHKEQMMAEMQYSDYTPQMLKDIGKVIGLGPAKLEAIFSGMGGTAVRDSIQMADRLLNPDAQIARSNEIPILSKFYSSPGDLFKKSKSYHLATDLYFDMKLAVNTINESRKEVIDGKITPEEYEDRAKRFNPEYLLVTGKNAFSPIGVNSRIDKKKLAVQTASDRYDIIRKSRDAAMLAQSKGDYETASIYYRLAHDLSVQFYDTYSAELSRLRKQLK